MLIGQPEPQALAALAQLSRLSGWEAIDKLITSELEAIFARMCGASQDADLHALRGRAQAMKEFQQLVRDAPDQLAKRGITAPFS